MKKTFNKSLFVGGLFLVVLVLIGLFYFGPTDLFQGRISFRSTAVSTVSPVIAPFCITPEELQKKYDDMWAGPPAEDDEQEGSDEPKAPGLIGGGTGSGGGMVVDGGFSGTTASKEPKYASVDCDCKDEGKEWYVDDENGESVLYSCYVDLKKCLKPNLKCPRGKVVDTLGLYPLCKKSVDQYCNGAAQVNSDLQSVCKAQFPGDIAYACPTKDKCEKYKSLFSMNIYTATIMAQEGISHVAADDKLKACQLLHGTKWYGN